MFAHKEKKRWGIKEGIERDAERKKTEEERKQRGRISDRLGKRGQRDGKRQKGGGWRGDKRSEKQIGKRDQWQDRER